MLEKWDRRALAFPAFAFFAAKSIVITANYGKPRDAGTWGRRSAAQAEQPCVGWSAR
jgi:hypothetical protein